MLLLSIFHTGGLTLALIFLAGVLAYFVYKADHSAGQIVQKLVQDKRFPKDPSRKIWQDTPERTKFWQSPFSWFAVAILIIYIIVMVRIIN
jgi:TctA family transporter